MLLQEELSYESGQIELSTSNLESITTNIGDRVGQTKIKITFLNDTQKNSYLISEQRLKERDDNIEINSDEGEDDEEGGDEIKKQMKKVVPMRAKVGEKREIPVSFELSILLREKYYSDLEAIAKRLEVRFKVVPSKVNIMGWKSDLVDQAQKEYAFIQDKIRLVPVFKAGRQIYQSKFYTNLLKQNSIQMMKILNKYFCWFEEGCSDPTEVLKKALTTTKHISFPLYQKKQYIKKKEEVEQVDMVHGELYFKEWKYSIFADLISHIKGIIFQKYIEHEINRLQSRKDRHVQLSFDKKDLIFHLDTQEQVDIQQKNIENLYKSFIFTFIIFNQDDQMSEVATFLANYSASSPGFKKNKQSNRSLFFFHIIHNYVCLAFQTPEYDIASGKIEEYELMKFFRSIPPELLTFKLAVESEFGLSEQNKEFKKFSFERDFVEKITFISLKNPSPKNYEKLFEFYIQKKFIPEQKIKKELDEPQNQLSQSASIDMSRPVDETTLMLNQSLNNSLLSLSEEKANVSNILPAELTSNINQHVFKFHNYTFNIKERQEDREKRYSDKVVAPKRSIASFIDSPYEEEIKTIVKFKFKLYPIKVPLQYKQLSIEAQVKKTLTARPDLQHLDKEVIVFYGGREPKDHENIYSKDKCIKVLRLGDNHYIRQGYLLKTNVVLMFEEFQKKETVELPYGKYEAIFFLKKLD